MQIELLSLPILSVTTATVTKQPNPHIKITGNSNLDLFQSRCTSRNITWIFLRHTNPIRASKISHGTAALALRDLLGWAWNENILPCQGRGSTIGLRVRRHVLLAVDLEYLCQDGLEGILDVSGLQRWGLQEEEVLLLGELLGILGAHGTLLLKVTLVSDQHDDNVLVGMPSELFQPTRNVVETLAFGDVID